MLINKKNSEPFWFGVFQRVKKVCKTFLHASKHATFFVKRSFTKNLAMLVKKPDNSGVFDGYNLI